MDKTKIKGHLYAFCSVVLIALLYSAIQSVSPTDIPASGIVIFRVFFGAVLFWIISLFLPKEKIEKQDMLLMIGAGLFGVFPYQYLFVTGISKTSAIDASIINTCSPIVIFLLAVALHNQHFTLKKVFGLLLGLGGAILTILLQTNDKTGIHHGNIGGDLMVLGAAILYASYIVSIREVSKKYRPVTVMKWTFGSGAIPTLLVGFKPMLESPLMNGNDSLKVIGICFSICIIMTVIPYLLIPIGIKILTPTIFGMYNYLGPVIAAITSILLGQDRLMWDQPIALILILIGVTLVNKKEKKISSN